MGAEELRKRRQTHNKYIDRQRVLLATPDLFTQVPENRPRSCVAIIEPGENVVPGERLVVEEGNNCLVGRRGETTVLTMPYPTTEMLHDMRNAAGIASGEVLEVHNLSRRAQVTLK
jgi:hypothetical protein